MSKPLDDHNILSIHRQYVAGIDIQSIANTLGVCRHTVYRHLRGDTSPPPHLAAPIARLHGFGSFTPPRPRDAPDGYLTMREASLIVPGCPTAKHISRHATGELRPRLRSRRIDNLLVTRTDWVKSWVAAKYGVHPKGLAIWMKAAAEVIDPQPSPKQIADWLRDFAPDLQPFRVASAICVLLPTLERFLASTLGGEYRLSFPPGFVEACLAHKQSRDARLFIITSQVLREL